MIDFDGHKNQVQPARRRIKGFGLALILALAAAILTNICCSRSVSGATGKVAPPTRSEAFESTVTFPLKAGPLNRYLVDQRDVPFLIQGDSPWSLIVALATDEVEQYLQVRRNQGFNAILVNLIEHHFGGAENKAGAPLNRDSEGPFLTPGDFTTPNEAYFKHADWVLRRAGELGFVVFLTPCYLGYPDTEEGWYRELKANSLDACRSYGRYLGNRYGKMKNIIWVAGGDRNPGDARKQMLALVEGIREFDKGSLWTADCFPEYSAADQYDDQPWLAINSTYTYRDVAGKCLGDYLREPVRPSFLVESHYENDFGHRTAEDTRKQAWFAALSGTCGQFFGNRPVWLFDKGWFPALNSPGAWYQAYLRRCLLSRHWEWLTPESGQRLLADGLGTGTNRRAAAMSRDRLTAFVYLPNGGQVAVEMTVFQGPQVKAWWFNPRDGTSQEAGIFPTEKRHGFEAPAGGDWVLVLDSVAHDVPPPGMRSIFNVASTVLK